MIKTISLEIDQVLTKSSISSRILIEIDKILSNSRDSLEICSKMELKREYFDKLSKLQLIITLCIKDASLYFNNFNEIAPERQEHCFSNCMCYCNKETNALAPCQRHNHWTKTLKDHNI